MCSVRGGQGEKRKEKKNKVTSGGMWTAPKGEAERAELLQSDGGLSFHFHCAD